MDIQEIKGLCTDGEIRWTDHVIKRLLQRNITRDAVKCAIINGEIIENYPDDYPYPSCLVFGKSGDEILHVVCGIGEGELYIISAYRPDSEKWTDGLKVRKEPE